MVPLDRIHVERRPTTSLKNQRSKGTGLPGQLCGLHARVRVSLVPDQSFFFFFFLIRIADVSLTF